MEEKINRDGKDRLFCFIFGRAENRAWTLDLYNAVNGTEYTNPDDVEITTHQSSFNPNMPVRQLMYLGRQYDKYIKKTRQDIYGKKQMILHPATV